MPRRFVILGLTMTMTHHAPLIRVLLSAILLLLRGETMYLAETNRSKDRSFHANAVQGRTASIVAHIPCLGVYTACLQEFS